MGRRKRQCPQWPTAHPDDSLVDLWVAETLWGRLQAGPQPVGCSCWHDRFVLDTDSWEWKPEAGEGTTVSCGARQCVLAAESWLHNNLGSHRQSGHRNLWAPRNVCDQGCSKEAVHCTGLTVKLHVGDSSVVPGLGDYIFNTSVT